MNAINFLIQVYFYNNKNKNTTYAYVIAHYKIMQMHSYFFLLNTPTRYVSPSLGCLMCLQYLLSLDSLI